MNKTEFSRLVFKRSTAVGVVPTIPTGTTIDNTWLDTDLLIGEGFINVADDKFWFRTDNGLVEVSLSGISSNNYYTTQAYLSGQTVVFDRNDLIAAYSVDLSTAYLSLTGGTLTGGLSGTSLNLSSIGSGTSIYNIGIDSGGNVVTGTTGSSADLWSASTGSNSIIANNSTGNLASASYTLAAGSGNTAASAFAVVLGGEGNSISSNGLRGFIGGGSYNSLTGARGFIGAGQTNSNTGSNGFVGAGTNNAVQTSFGIIVGGSENFAKGAPGFAYVFAGTYNTASTENATVITGSYNLADGINSLILAGTGNTVTGRNSVILGGADINATADDTAYVPSLNIRTIGSGTSTINLGLDSSGNVVTGTTGGASETAFTGLTGGLIKTIIGTTVPVNEATQDTITLFNAKATSAVTAGFAFGSPSYNRAYIGNYQTETGSINSSFAFGPGKDNVDKGVNASLAIALSAQYWIKSGSTGAGIFAGRDNVIGYDALQSVIIGGSGNTINDGVTGSTIIGGNHIIATANDTLYTNNINTSGAILSGGTNLYSIFASAPTAGNYIGVTGSSVVSLTGVPITIAFAISDETTAITSGTSKLTYYLPHAMTLTSVRACLTTSGSTLTTVDINENDVSILSTKLTIDANEFSSTSAAAAPVISDANLADDAKITFDIDGAGTGAAGLKVTLIGYRSL